MSNAEPPPPGHLEYRHDLVRMHTDDIPQVVDLHLASLPSSFFASLGTSFLREYYTAFVLSPFAVAVISGKDGQVTGFVCGTQSPAAHAAWTVRRRGLRLAWVAAVALLQRPRVLVVFMRTRIGRYARGLSRRVANDGRGAVSSGRTAEPAVLSHIAVRADQRGSGLGRALVRRFCDLVRAEGAMAVELVTLAGPEGASNFYDRLGLEATGSRRDQDGAEWRYYRIHLSGPKAARP